MKKEAEQKQAFAGFHSLPLMEVMPKDDENTYGLGGLKRPARNSFNS